MEAIVTTGSQATADQLEAPPNVSVVGFLDHMEVVPTVDLVICHGGHSTAMRAVLSGIPVLVMPMHPMIDQRMVGTAIQTAGLGLMLKKKADPAAIAKAITTLLRTPSYRVAATQAARTDQAASGTSVAADVLDSPLTSRPATRSL